VLTLVPPLPGADEPPTSLDWVLVELLAPPDAVSEPPTDGVLIPGTPPAAELPGLPSSLVQPAKSSAKSGMVRRTDREGVRAQR
jgi:hypothetical protein